MILLVFFLKKCFFLQLWNKHTSIQSELNRFETRINVCTTSTSDATTLAAASAAIMLLFGAVTSPWQPPLMQLEGIVISHVVFVHGSASTLRVRRTVSRFKKLRRRRSTTQCNQKVIVASQIANPLQSVLATWETCFDRRTPSHDGHRSPFRPSIPSSRTVRLCVHSTFPSVYVRASISSERPSISHVGTFIHSFTRLVSTFVCLFVHLYRRYVRVRLSVRRYVHSFIHPSCWRVRPSGQFVRPSYRSSVHLISKTNTSYQQSALQDQLTQLRTNCWWRSRMVHGYSPRAGLWLCKYIVCVRLFVCPSLCVCVCGCACVCDICG